MSRKKILILGCSGQVGQSIKKVLKEDYDLNCLDRPSLDFNALKKLQKEIININPSVIINAAAYTSVDKAESEIIEANLCNHKGPQFLSKLCFEKNILFIHFSTDFVFDGKKKGSYSENDICNPLNVYGLSKREGEVQVSNSGCKHFIFRASWVYGPDRENFLKTILKMAKVKKNLEVVNDQFGLPTSTDLISSIVQQFLNLYFQKEIKTKDYGIYHLAPQGRVSWYEFACNIIQKASEEGFEIKTKLENVTPISSSDYSYIATRPKNTVLNTKKLKNFLGIEIYDWKKYLDDVLKQVRVTS